jgi:superfamily I DNA/RNA helicase
MTNKNRHLSDESIVALISETLNEAEEKRATEHLDYCADCMLNYSEMYMDLKEIESTKIESVPREILDSLGLPKEKESTGSIFSDFLYNVEQFVNWIIHSPSNKVSLAAVGFAVVFVALISIKLISDDERIKLTTGIHHLEFTSDTGEQMLSIHLSVDSLKISQILALKRQVVLIDKTGDVLLKESFESQQYLRSLKHLELSESIRFRLITDGHVTIDSLFSVKPYKR